MCSTSILTAHRARASRILARTASTRRGIPAGRSPRNSRTHPPRSPKFPTIRTPAQPMWAWQTRARMTPPQHRTLCPTQAHRTCKTPPMATRKRPARSQAAWASVAIRLRNPRHFKGYYFWLRSAYTRTTAGAPRVKLALPRTVFHHFFWRVFGLNHPAPEITPEHELQVGRRHARVHGTGEFPDISDDIDRRHQDSPRQPPPSDGRANRRIFKLIFCRTFSARQHRLRRHRRHHQGRPNQKIGVQVDRPISATLRAFPLMYLPDFTPRQVVNLIGFIDKILFLTGLITEGHPLGIIRKKRAFPARHTYCSRHWLSIHFRDKYRKKPSLVAVAVDLQPKVVIKQ